MTNTKTTSPAEIKWRQRHPQLNASITALVWSLTGSSLGWILLFCTHRLSELYQFTHFQSVLVALVSAAILFFGTFLGAMLAVLFLMHEHFTDSSIYPKNSTQPEN